MVTLFQKKGSPCATWQALALTIAFTTILSGQHESYAMYLTANKDTSGSSASPLQSTAKIPIWTTRGTYLATPLGYGVDMPEALRHWTGREVHFLMSPPKSPTISSSHRDWRAPVLAVQVLSMHVCSHSVNNPVWNPGLNGVFQTRDVGLDIDH